MIHVQGASRSKTEQFETGKSKSLLLETFFLFHKDTLDRVQKTLNSSYKPDPEILNLPTLSGTRRENECAKVSYFKN